MKKSLVVAIIFVSSFAFGRTVIIDVEKHIPLYETQETTKRVQKCKNNVGDDKNIIGTVAGAATGGILGNQVGKGKGKTAATIAGTVIGGYAGNKIEDEIKGNRRNCYYVDEPVTKKTLVGYKNVGYYNGKQYSKISEEKQQTIRVEIEE